MNISFKGRIVDPSLLDSSGKVIQLDKYVGNSAKFVNNVCVFSKMLGKLTKKKVPIPAAFEAASSVSAFAVQFLTADAYFEICRKILIEFRDAIEGSGKREKTLELCQIPMINRSGNYYSPSEKKIYLNFIKGIDVSNELASRDILLGSLGHELGHFYVDNYLNTGDESVHPYYNELMADFLSGFFYGLDQDDDPKTTDMNLKGRLEYFAKDFKNNPVIPGTQNVRAEMLDGVHPFYKIRNIAIVLGYNRGVKTQELPIGTDGLKTMLEGVARQIIGFVRNDDEMKNIIKGLLVYNKNNSRFPYMENDLAFPTTDKLYVSKGKEALIRHIAVNGRLPS